MQTRLSTHTYLQMVLASACRTLTNASCREKWTEDRKVDWELDERLGSSISMKGSSKLLLPVADRASPYMLCRSLDVRKSLHRVRAKLRRKERESERNRILQDQQDVM